MVVVSRRVSAFMTAARTGNYVVRVENAFTVREIGEEEDRRLALLASNNDVPPPRFGRKHGRGHHLLSENLVQTGKPGSSSQFFS